jgi:hypothetical protein
MHLAPSRQYSLGAKPSITEFNDKEREGMGKGPKISN